MAATAIEVDADGTSVRITNPTKLYFSEAGYTKLDVVSYYLSVAEVALAGVRDRPMILKRFVKGTSEPPFFQKRAPANLPPGSRRRAWHSRAAAGPTFA